MSKAHRSFFNELAETWHNKTSAESLLASLHSFGVQPGDLVLDIGSGTGILTTPLSELTKTGHVFAIDLSENMLHAARKNCRSSNIDYSCSDACHLSFLSNSIDKIVCYSTFPHLQKPCCALAEFYRVLVPGGKALIFHNCCSRKLNQHHAKMSSIVSFDKLPKSEYLQSLMADAGFVKIKTIEQPDLYWVEAEKKFV